MHDRHANLLCWAALALFTVGLVAVNINYSRADRRPPTYDDAWFLENSLIFHHRLTEGGLRAFLPAYASSFGTKAPLLSVLPLPLYLIFGTGQQTALLVNSLFVVISSLYLFLLVRRLFSPAAGLAAVVFYQTMPLAYGLSRAFLADYGLTALVIVWLYYLVASEQLSHSLIDLLLGTLLGLGLLMKVLFPAYIAGPLLLTWWWRRQSAPLDGPRRPLVAIAVPGLAIAATWYAFHWRTILRYAWQGAYGEIGAQYGFGGLKHWLTLVVDRGLSFYYCAALVVLGFAALVLARRRPAGDRKPVLLLLAWLVPPLLATAAGQNREIRLFIPLLPVFAIFLALAVCRLATRRWIQAVLIAALAVFPLRLYAELSFVSLGGGHAGHDHDHPVKAGPFVLFGRDLGWARPPDAKGAWEQRRLLEALRSLGAASASPRYVVVGLEHPYLNANLLSYLNAYTHYPLLFTSLGYAEPSVERALERVYRLDARYLVLAEGFHTDELVGFLNQVNRGVQERLDRGELPFRHRAGVTLTHGIRAHIYERLAPWSRYPPGASVPPPSRPLVVDFSGGVRFLGYDWKRRDDDLAELTCHWAAPYPIADDYRVHLTFHRDGHPVLVQDHLIGDGRHPMFEWVQGETVHQTLILYLPKGGAWTARLWLTAWGLGDPHQVAGPREYLHDSVIPLRLEE